MDIDRDQILTCARTVLLAYCLMTRDIFGRDAAIRLFGEGEDPELWDHGDFSKTGSAGEAIEKSKVMQRLKEIIIFLGTNQWQGDYASMDQVRSDMHAFESFLSAELLDYQEEPYVPEATKEPLMKAISCFIGKAQLEFDIEWMTVKRLSAASGFAEKTIRMAAGGRTKNPDLLTHKQGHNLFITAESAKQWMAKKNRPYQPVAFISDERLPKSGPDDFLGLSSLLRKLRASAGLDYDQLADKLGWKEEIRYFYECLEDEMYDGSNWCNEDHYYSAKFAAELSTALAPNEKEKFIEMVDAVLHPIFFTMEYQFALEQ